MVHRYSSSIGRTPNPIVSSILSPSCRRKRLSADPSFHHQHSLPLSFFPLRIFLQHQVLTRKPLQVGAMFDGKKERRRRSSSLIYTEPPESIEHISDQSALPNINADWVNAKGKSLDFEPPMHQRLLCSVIGPGCQEVQWSKTYS